MAHEPEYASTLEENRKNKSQRAHKVELLAAHLKFIHQALWEHDPEFIRQCGNDMANDANRMEAAAVLIRNFSVSKSELLRTQGKAMLLLAEYMDTVNECGKLKRV